MDRSVPWRARFKAPLDSEAVAARHRRQLSLLHQWLSPGRIAERARVFWESILARLDLKFDHPTMSVPNVHRPIRP